jgi:hypothetical protein
MWKLPNGKTISHPRDVLIGDTMYPAQIFRRWSKLELGMIGIFPFREERFDSQYYRSTGTTDVEIDGGIVRQHTTTKKYNGQQLRALFADKIKQNLRSLWKTSQEEHEYLLMFEPSNQDDIDTWMQYKTDLINSAQTIKAAFLALTDYEEGITFIREYTTMLPNVPFQEIIET